MDLHLDILMPAQQQLLPRLLAVTENYYLVGGTAIALYLGHRLSIDFDLFSHREIAVGALQRTLTKAELTPAAILFKEDDQFTCIIDEVKCTFMHFPWKVPYTASIHGMFAMPALLDLAAMKAFALGRRSKYKDYVDLHWLIVHEYSVEEIIGRAKEIFEGQFNEKLFRIQLGYHEDIDFSEGVEYRDKAYTKEEVLGFLQNSAVQE